MTHRFGSRKIDDDTYGFVGRVNSPFTTIQGKFNGTVITHPERLSIPLKRRKPTVYAIWNDLFHEAVPDSFIKSVVDMAQEARGRHTILCLTKRPLRALKFWETVAFYCPPNLCHGLTVCNQREADEKIPIFLQVPGKRFLSIEPMLGAVDLTHISISTDNRSYINTFTGGQYCYNPIGGNHKTAQWGEIDAVILGGETGSGARPMHPDWVRAVRDQCAAAGVPFFFKGWGEWRHESQFGQHIPSLRLLTTKTQRHKFEDGSYSYRVRKERTGRLLDGRTHDDLPWIKLPLEEK